MKLLGKTDLGAYKLFRPGALAFARKQACCPGTQRENRRGRRPELYGAGRRSRAQRRWALSGTARCSTVRPRVYGLTLRDRACRSARPEPARMLAWPCLTRVTWIRRAICFPFHPGQISFHPFLSQRSPGKTTCILSISFRVLNLTLT